MFRTSFLMFGLSVMCSAGIAETWDVKLDMNVDPWSATPSWTFSGTSGVYGTRVSDAEASEHYYRNINTLPDAATSSSYYRKNAVFTPNFDTGFTAESRIRWYNGTIPGAHNILIRSDGTNGGTAGYIYASPYYRYSSGWHFGLRINGTDYSLLDTFTPISPYTDPSPWYTIRMVIQDGEGSVYVNDSLLVTVDVSGTATENSITFGDVSSGASGNVDYDYVYYSYSVVPEPFACAALIGSSLILFRRRQNSI